MGSSWITLRLFVSSTFLDMQAERDHLVRFVFPRLRQQLLARRIHFVDVDLRWGVTSEQDTLAACRQIIDDCRPWFLSLLGGRYGWVPPGRRQSITAEEIHYAVLDRGDRSGCAFFYFRADDATTAMEERRAGEFRERSGSDAARRLAALKQAIAFRGHQPVVYPARWDSELGRLTGLETFGERVERDLLAAVDRQLPGRLGAAVGDEALEEAGAMERFAEEEAVGFVVGSRQGVLEQLESFALGDDGPSLLLVSGEAGCGKTALLSHLWLRLQATGEEADAAVVIAHFPGASVAATDLRLTLRRLCRELSAPELGSDPLPQQPHQLIHRFDRLLAQTGRRRILILDAIDQLQTPAGEPLAPHWLPRSPAPGARLIVAADDRRILEPLRELGQEGRLREISLAPLTAADGRQIVDRFLARYGKRLSAEQRAALLAKADAQNPLYLTSALEELRTLGRQEEIHRRIGELPGRLQDLFQWTLERLEADPGFHGSGRRRPGRHLVAGLARALGTARQGMRLDELAAQIAPGNPDAEPPLPPDRTGDVAALERLLRRQLSRRGELLSFAHQAFRRAADQRYLPDAAARRRGHGELAAFFTRAANPEGSGWRNGDRHALYELPYQLAEAGQWSALRRTLRDLYFLEAKCAAGLTDDLIADCERLGAGDAEAELRSEAGQLRSFLVAEAHILRRTPELLCQQAAHQPPGSLPAELAGRQPSRRPWLRWRNRPLRPLASRLTFQPVTGGSLCAATDPEARRVAVVGGRWLHLVDLAAGGRQQHWLLGGAPVTACAFTPDAARLLCGHRDGELSLWDLERQRHLARCRIGANPITTLASGDTVALAGDGGPVAYGWDYRQPSPGFTLETGLEAITACALHPHRPWAVLGGPEAAVEIWDYQHHRRRARMRGSVRSHDILGQMLLAHRDRIVDCDFSADGRYLALAQRDQSEGALYVLELGEEDISCPLTYRPRPQPSSLFNRPTRVEGSISCCAQPTDGPLPIAIDSFGNLLRFEPHGDSEMLVGLLPQAHQGPCLLCRVSRDGRRLVSVEESGLGRLWEVADLGSQLTYDRQPHVRVWSGAVSADGRRAVLCRDDGSLGLYDAQSGESLRELREGGGIRWYDHPWRCALWMPDGHHVLCGGDEDHTFTLWNVELGEPAGAVFQLGAYGRLCRRSPCGRYALLVTADGVATLVDLVERRQLRVLERSGVPPSGCDFTASGAALVGWRDGLLSCWDWRRDQLRWQVPAHPRGPVVCAAHPAQPLAVTGGAGGSLRWWRTDDGSELRHAAVDQAVSACATSPDGRWLAVCGPGLLLFDWHRGEPVALFPTVKEVALLAFTGPDALCLGSSDGELVALELEAGRGL